MPVLLSLSGAEGAGVNFCHFRGGEGQASVSVTFWGGGWGASAAPGVSCPTICFYNGPHLGKIPAEIVTTSTAPHPRTAVTRKTTRLVPGWGDQI